MRIIDLASPTLSLVSPMEIKRMKRMNYYSASMIEDDDILYAANDDGFIIYRAAGTSCQKQKRSIRIGGTDRKPVLAPYLVRTFLHEVRCEDERARIHDLMIEAGALPF